jgi:predicted O-linked N-acetylglucosamine transferase (SPINDLY family)
LSKNAFTLQELAQRANAAYQAGDLGEAERCCKAILRTKPDHSHALHLLSVIALRRGRCEESVQLAERALAIKPHFSDALVTRANALRALDRQIAALESYDKALAQNPRHVQAWNNRGNALYALNRHAEALESYDKALALKSDYAQALNNRGIALSALKRHEEALTSFDRALAVAPKFPESLRNRGNALGALGRHSEALANYEQALALSPGFAEALNGRGIALAGLNRHDEAIASFDRALALRPNYGETLVNWGNVLFDLRRPDEALERYDRALALKSNYADAHYHRGCALAATGRYDEALASYANALTIESDHLYAHGGLLGCAGEVCDWARAGRLRDELVGRIRARTSVVAPLTWIAHVDDPFLQLECATNYLQDKMRIRPAPLWKGEVRRSAKIRVAYLSSDFRGHVVGNAIVELIELHDRTAFEVIGVSFGPDDQSSTRSRLLKAFDRFHDVTAMADRDIAVLLHDLGVDIAVDLNGHTTMARPGVLAHRPAPIQVNYLGFPGTMGADFVDYVIADGAVLTEDQQPFFSECIVRLPDCYLVSDTTRTIAAQTPTRGEAGLPDAGFVFCCFNACYKITTPVFDVWMRLLGANDGSVLWLARANAAAVRNLQIAAQARGIDPARLIFAPRLDRLEDHLARHRLADLFLDTLPYNAHSTASDALWAGLPLLTCRGNSFASRVSSSLLQAIGLPELVTSSLDEYESLALTLAGDPPLLASYRMRLADNRLVSPLFKTDRTRRHIEAAYVEMWKMWQSGQRPRLFAVGAIQSDCG